MFASSFNIWPIPDCKFQAGSAHLCCSPWNLPRPAQQLASEICSLGYCLPSE